MLHVGKMSPDAHCNSPITEIHEVTLRFLVPEDIEQVKELCHEWFPVEYPSFWYECITETSQYYALAAIHADIIVGLLVAQTKPLCDVNEEDAQLLRQARLFGGNVGYILTLGVRRQHRRQGLASLLLNHYIEHLRLDCNRKYAKHRRLQNKEEATKTQEIKDGGDGSDGRKQRRSPVTDAERRCNKKKQSSTPGRGGDRRTGRNQNDSGSEKNNIQRNGRTILESKPNKINGVNVNSIDTLNEVANSEIKQDTTVVIDFGMNADGVSSQDSSTSGVSDDYRESNSQNMLLQSEKRDCLVDLGIGQFSRKVQELSLKCSGDAQGSTVTENQMNSVINTPSNSSLASRSCGASGKGAAVGEVHPFVSPAKPNKNVDRSRNLDQNFVSSMLLKSHTNNNDTVPPRSLARAAASSCSSSRSSVEITMELEATPVTDEFSESIMENFSSPPLGCATFSHGRDSESGLSSADSLLSEEGAEVSTSTINSSYIVETSLLCSSVLQRVQCNDEEYAAAPVTAVMLHVLTTNQSAIRFYTSRHFARQAFLPMFYVINNERRDGYSYVLYINGGQPPSPGFSLLPRPFQQLARPLGSSLSQLAQPLADQVGKMSQWLLSGVGGTGGGGLLSVLVGGMVGVLGKVVSSVVTVGRRA